MRNRQRNLRLSTWLMLALMIGSILSPTVSLATTVESTTSSEEQTEKTLQTLSSDLSIPSSSGTKPSENSTQSSTEETSTVEFTENSEVTISDNEEKPKTIVTQNTDTIDEHQLLIHEDPTNPQPSIKDQKIQQIEDKVYFSGKLFAGIEEGDKTESRTIVSKFALQLKNSSHEWQTVKEWLTDEVEVSHSAHSFETMLTLEEDDSYFRYILTYKVETYDNTEQSLLLKEEQHSGYIKITETYHFTESKSINDITNNEFEVEEGPKVTRKEVAQDAERIDNEKKGEGYKGSTNSFYHSEKKSPNVSNEIIKLDKNIKLTEIYPIDSEKKSVYSTLDLISPRSHYYDTFGTELVNMKGTANEMSTGIYGYEGHFTKNPDNSISVSGQLIGVRETLSSGSLAYERIVKGIFILYREKGTGTWTKGTQVWSGSKSNEWIQYSGTQSGIQLGKIYEFAVGVNFLHNGSSISSWPTLEMSGWFGATSGGTQDFRIRSAIGTPENWTGNNGPNAVFYSPVTYRNGANLSHVVIEYKELGEPDSSFKKVPRDKISDYSGGVVAYIEGLPANKTYSVRAMVYDPYFKEECYSPTWGEHITKCSSIATPKDITYATVGQANGPTAVFSASVNCQNGTLITNAWMEIKLEGAPDSEFVPVACTKNSSNEAQAQFTNLEPNKKYVIRAYVVDTYYEKIYSPEWATYETYSSTIGKPFDVSVTHKGRKPNSPNPVFYAYVDLKNDTKIEENKVNMQIRLSTQTNESDFVTVPCTLEQPGIVKAEFTGLLPNRIYHIRAFVDDEIFGRQWASYWADDYYTTTSKAETPVLEGIDDISATLKTKVSFYNGSNISNVKTEISSDGGITWANNVSCSLENDDAQAIFTGLQPNTRYEVRTYIDDHDYGKQYSPIWGHFTTNYNVYENFHDMSGLAIKQEKKSVKKGQQYSPVVQNTFTHNSQAYIYKGWISGADWNGTAMPMPISLMKTNPVAPLTTHNEKVYLIYDLDSNSLRLDEYPNKFDFGNQHRPESYNQVFDLDASKYASTEPTDGFKLRVRDDRVAHPGWRLTSTFSQLVGVNNTSDQLVGAKISFGVELKEIQNPGTPSETAITPTPAIAPSFGAPVSGSTATLTADGSSLIFLRAPNTKGEGVWDVLIDFDSVKLFVPGGQGSTGEEYQGTIQWDLEDAP